MFIRVTDIMAATTVIRIAPIVVIIAAGMGTGRPTRIAVAMGTAAADTSIAEAAMAIVVAGKATEAGTAADSPADMAVDLAGMAAEAAGAAATAAGIGDTISSTCPN
jgi:trans-2-enoyl-CoA reductase